MSISIRVVQFRNPESCQVALAGQPLTPTTARDRISTVDEQNLPKCLYYDFKSIDREEQKKHLREKHHAKMVEIAMKGNQTIEWAVGFTASYFTIDK